MRAVSELDESQLKKMDSPELNIKILQGEEDLSWRWPNWKKENRDRFEPSILNGAELAQEKSLIAGYLHNDPMHLHPRRTLDQFYYHMLGEEELEKRDQDQVVYRWMMKKKQMKDHVNEQNGAMKSAPEPRKEKKPTDPKVIMVDQLWLWVIDESKNSSISIYPSIKKY